VVACAEECEKDTGCHHWNYNVMNHGDGHKCQLKSEQGMHDEDKHDWVTGHAVRYDPMRKKEDKKDKPEAKAPTDKSDKKEEHHEDGDSKKDDKQDSKKESKKDSDKASEKSKKEDKSKDSKKEKKAESGKSDEPKGVSEKFLQVETDSAVAKPETNFMAVAINSLLVSAAVLGVGFFLVAARKVYVARETRSFQRQANSTEEDPLVESELQCIE